MSKQEAVPGVTSVLRDNNDIKIEDQSPQGQKFNYNQAFSRNLGWLSKKEQSTLKNCKVAIAGMGGVGGSHLLTLARLGIGNFHLADFDHFELHNFNRQAGANIRTIDQPKVEVMAAEALNIDPEINITCFREGVTAENIDRFLAGVDLFIDGLDIFALDIRAKVFQRCHELGIPAITAAPLGMGTAMLNFMPGKMSFEEYFGFKGMSEFDRFVRLLAGVSPSFLQMRALADRSSVDPMNGKVPSTAMGCQLASGVIGTEALKILLKRGPVTCAPMGVHFDAYTHRLKKTWTPWGWKNPLFRLKVFIIKRMIRRSKSITSGNA